MLKITTLQCGLFYVITCLLSRWAIVVKSQLTASTVTELIPHCQFQVKLPHNVYIAFLKYIGFAPLVGTNVILCT